MTERIVQEVVLDKDDKQGVVDNKSMTDIITMIETHRQNAYRKVNEELVTLYYEMGEYISSNIKDKKWGSGAIDEIATKIKSRYPAVKGFDRSNIYRMINFYEAYCDNTIVATLSRQIGWCSNYKILESTNSIEEKEFYIRLCIKNNYSYRELCRQLKSHYYERYTASNGTALESIEKVDGEEDYPNTKILDLYSFEFLDLGDGYSEKDLKKAIVKNLKSFILEIGKDFTFVGEEYHIEVGGQDFYIDLLFYNRTYSCLVAIELKTDEFKPEYISKMNFYLEALDRQERKEGENPSVGIILCTKQNKTVVKYATARSNSPLQVAEYATKILNKKLLESRVNKLAQLLSTEEDEE